MLDVSAAPRFHQFLSSQKHLALARINISNMYVSLFCSSLFYTLTICAEISSYRAWVLARLLPNVHVRFSRLSDTVRCNTVDEGAIRVPTLNAPPNEDHELLWICITTAIVATLFGGINCAGWNFPFLSHAELIIWRVSCLIIVISSVHFCTSICRRRYENRNNRHHSQSLVIFIGHCVLCSCTTHPLCKLEPP